MNEHQEACPTVALNMGLRECDCPDKIVFVSAYEVTRHYGGPEEGGWWYDWYELIQSVPVAVTDIDTMIDHLKEKHGDRAEGDRFSVLGGVAVSVLVEDQAGEFQTKGRPYYE